MMTIPYVLYGLAFLTFMLFAIDFKVPVGRLTRDRLHAEMIRMNESIAHRICLLKYGSVFAILGVVTNLLIVSAGM